MTTDYTLSDEQLEHHERALASGELVSSFSPDQHMRAYSALGAVQIAAHDRWGVAPDAASILATAGVQSHITHGGTFDLESVLFQLASKDIRVARHRQGAEIEESKTAPDFAHMTPAQRISEARRRGIEFG